MNPMSAGGDYEFLHFIWEHLVTYSVVPNTVSKNPFSGQYGPLVPELADSLGRSRPTRRPGRSSSIRASSGRTARDFTSADVKFSFELCLNPKVGPCYPGGSMKSIVGAEDVTKGTTTDLVGVKAPGPADGHDRDDRTELAPAVQRHGPVHPPEVLARGDRSRDDGEERLLPDARQGRSAPGRSS